MTSFKCRQEQMGYSAYQLYYFSDLCPGLGVQSKRWCCGCSSRYICVTFHGCKRSVVNCFSGIFSSIKGKSGIYCIC